MIGPSIRLRSEITAGDARHIAAWLEDGEAVRYLSEAPGVSAAIRRALDAQPYMVTQLFNRDGRFFIAEERGMPVGFVRLAPRGEEAQLVLMVERSRWGRRLGGAMLREALAFAFFETRVSKVVAVIHRDNHRSQRLFQRAGFRTERVGEWTRHALSLNEYIKSIRGGVFMACELTISRIDKDRLNRLIDEALFGGAEPVASYHALRSEIERARVVEPRTLPPNVVSMRSRALIALDGEEEEAELVYPDEADWTRGRLSVLSPVGTALLGYREGEEIDWDAAGGRIHIEIRRILYQPEAAGDYHL